MVLLNLLFAHCINVKVIFLIGFILKDKGKVKEMATIKHQAARAAFGAAADVTLKYLNKDPEKREKSLLKIVDLTESFAKDRFKPESYEAAKAMIRDKDSKWMQYVNRIFDEVSPNVIKKTAMNLGFEAMLSGTKIMHEMREKYQCNIPWLLLIDPTSACNLHCTGCWAAEYGHTMSLTYDELDSIITQGKELGIYLYMYTGGEPLVRKADIIKLCEKHNDCAFHAFTNGTLVDDAFCEEMDRVGNLSLSISLEGYEEVNDGRRGQGVFDKVMKAMDTVRQKGYGMVLPEKDEIRMEDPVLIHQSGKYGVKLRALSPSVHMIRANIETEIAPIVGSEEQAKDLIQYIQDGRKQEEGIWQINIFGKTIEELVEDGIRSKLYQIGEESQVKLQDTMQKIVNDSNGGLVCIII